MFTDNEFRISNLSYTDKDFNAIYPELLDMVKKLSYKWDPTISNESDPGVLLLKLNALIADKSNYNIDKNILETFPLSVTQERNARELFDSLGYSMKWYRAGTGTVQMVWNSDVEYDDNQEIVTYNIPQFTMLSNNDNSLIYTVINKNSTLNSDTSSDTSSDITLSTNKDALYLNVIQGSVVEYRINDDNIINISYLDEENKLYFTDNNVAENGIFITSSTESKQVLDFTEWRRVDNLSIQDVGTKCYKFGVDLYSNSCYIQFPNDIDQLIGNGLRIYYIVTNGSDGNAPKNTIINLYSTIPDSNVSNDKLKISNIDDITNGSDPENIDNGYLNYKKTVGTFETLVSLRDYINAIYNLRSVNSNGVENGYMVSNDVVADRTTDIQTATYIVTLDEYKKEKVVLQKASENGEDLLQAFDLKLYVLHYMNDPETIAAYNSTFELENNFDGETDGTYPESLVSKVLDKEVETDSMGNVIDYRTGIYQQIEDIKSIQHNYKTLLKNRICIIKNKYPIVCKVIPQYKVTEKEISEIINNIIKTLFVNLNARKIDFGQEPVYDYIYNLIQNSDARIKSIVLDDFQYTAFAVFYHEYEKDGKTIKAGLKEINISMPYEQYIKGQLLSDGSWEVSETNLTIKGYFENVTAMKLATNSFGDSGAGYYMVTDTSTIYRFNPTYSEEALRWTAWSSTIIPAEKGNPNAIYTDNINIYLFNSNRKAFEYFMPLELLTDMKLEIYAKCVLAGYTNLNTPDNNFQYTANQSLKHIIKDVQAVTTNTNININSSSSNVGEYDLKENENILLYSPALTDSVNYSSYVKYECDLSNGLVFSDNTAKLNSVSYNAITGSTPRLYKPQNQSNYLSINLTKDKYYMVDFDNEQYIVQASETSIVNKNNNTVLVSYLGYITPYEYQASGSVAGEALTTGTIGDSSLPFGVFSYEGSSGCYICAKYSGTHTISVSELNNYNETIIPANSNYQLKAGQYVTFFWKSNDANNYYDYAKYIEGDVICPSFELKSNVSGQTVTSKLPEGVKKGNTSRMTESLIVGNKSVKINTYLESLTSPQSVLSTNKSITIKTMNVIDLSDATSQVNFKYAYWILNDTIQENGVKYYQLFKNYQANEEYILKSGEYLIYTNATQSELYILGSGTLITKKGKGSEDMYKRFNWKVPVIDYSKVVSDGSDALSNYWVSVNSIRTYNDLTITEMRLVTLANGSTIRLSTKDGQSFDVTISGDQYKPVDLANFNIEYKNKNEGTWQTLDEVSLQNSGWKAMSFLVLKCGNGVENAQTLLPNQSITFHTINGDDIISAIQSQNEEVTISAGQVECRHAIPTSWNTSQNTSLTIQNVDSGIKYNLTNNTFFDENNNLIYVHSDNLSKVEVNGVEWWAAEGINSPDANGYYFADNIYQSMVLKNLKVGVNVFKFNTNSEAIKQAAFDLMFNNSNSAAYYIGSSATYLRNALSKGDSKYHEGWRLLSSIPELFEIAAENPLNSSDEFKAKDAEIRNAGNGPDNVFYLYQEHFYYAWYGKGLIKDYVKIINKDTSAVSSLVISQDFGTTYPIFFRSAMYGPGAQSVIQLDEYWCYDGNWRRNYISLDGTVTDVLNSIQNAIGSTYITNVSENSQIFAIPINYRLAHNYIGDVLAFDPTSRQVAVTKNNVTTTLFANEDDIICRYQDNTPYIYNGVEWVELGGENLFTPIKYTGIIFKYIPDTYTTATDNGITLLSNNYSRSGSNITYNTWLADKVSLQIVQGYADKVFIQSNPDIDIGGGSNIDISYYDKNSEKAYPMFYIYEATAPDLITPADPISGVTDNNVIVTNYDGSLSVYFSKAQAKLINIIPDKFLAFDDSTIVKEKQIKGDVIFNFDLADSSQRALLADPVVYWLSQGKYETYASADSNIRTAAKNIAQKVLDNIATAAETFGISENILYATVKRTLLNSYQLSSEYYDDPDTSMPEGFSVISANHSYVLRLKLPKGSYILPIQNIGSNIAGLSVSLSRKVNGAVETIELTPYNSTALSKEFTSYAASNSKITKTYSVDFKPMMIDLACVSQSTTSEATKSTKHIIITRPDTLIDGKAIVYMNGSSVEFTDSSVIINAIPNGVLNAKDANHTISYIPTVFDQVFSNNQIYQYKIDMTDDTPGSNNNYYQINIAVQDDADTPEIKAIKILPIYKFDVGTNGELNNAAILAKIKELDPDNLFNMTHRVDPSLEIINPLAGASFNLSHHPYHNFTICQVSTLNVYDNISILNKIR